MWNAMLDRRENDVMCALLTLSAGKARFLASPQEVLALVRGRWDDEGLGARSPRSRRTAMWTISPPSARGKRPMSSSCAPRARHFCAIRIPTAAAFSYGCSLPPSAGSPPRSSAFCSSSSFHKQLTFLHRCGMIEGEQKFTFRRSLCAHPPCVPPSRGEGGTWKLFRRGDNAYPLPPLHGAREGVPLCPHYTRQEKAYSLPPLILVLRGARNPLFAGTAFCFTPRTLRNVLGVFPPFPRGSVVKFPPHGSNVRFPHGTGFLKSPPFPQEGGIQGGWGGASSRFPQKNAPSGGRLFL